MIKKLILFIFIFVIICLTLPAIMAKNDAKEQTVAYKNENIEEQYVYKDDNKIKLLHLETNEIEEILLDEYLYGVVSAEMPANYDIEALKAQAIVARTYTIYKIKNGSKHEGADICDTSTCCQAYITKEKRFEKWNENEREANWKKIVDAVDSTSGKIITYNGEPINAFFHANSGGETEIVSNVWGGTDYPYLQTVATSGEEDYTQYSSSVILTKEEVLQKLRENHPEAVIDFNIENEIQILEHTDRNIEISGVEARETFGLRSANFNVVIGENVMFDVIGYGHGVGMSQTGADSLAKQGKNHEEIIKHFYSGVEIQNL